MKFLKQLGNYMMLGARYHAQWELEMSNRIPGDRKRMFVLLLPTARPFIPRLSSWRRSGSE
jgi:hypothetical protein